MLTKSTPLFAHFQEESVWECGGKAKPGWYVSVIDDSCTNGNPACFTTQDGLGGWFVSREDCERALNYLNDNEITADQLNCMNDFDIKRNLYSGLAW